MIGLWDLAKTTGGDKVLREKAFNIAKNPTYDGQRNLTSMVYNFFDKKSPGSDIKNETTQNQQLAEELNK